MNSRLFLFVVVIIAIVMVAAVAARGHSVLAVGIAAAFGGLGGYAVASQQPSKTGFTTITTAMPGAGAPHVVPGSVPKSPNATPDGELGAQPYASDEPYDSYSYPGAIALDEYDTAPALGHVDRQASTAKPPSEGGVPEGNPFTSNRIAAPVAAGACIDDDAVAVYDGDEQNAMQVRARNDQTRVWAGTFRRYEIADRYMREELDETEDTRWWGRHEV